jgi:hypothetical protein
MVCFASGTVSRLAFLTRKGRLVLLFLFLHYTLFPQECRSSDLFDGWIASLLFVAIVYGYLGRMLLPCGNNPKGMLAFRIQFKYIIKNFHLPCTPVVLSCAIRTTSEVDLEHRDSGNSGSLAAAHACKCIDYHARLSRKRASRLTVWRYRILLHYCFGPRQTRLCCASSQHSNPCLPIITRPISRSIAVGSAFRSVSEAWPVSLGD